jgi:S1-C subfamily serine protease
VHADRFSGAGLVVDAERGLVVVDRETVPIALGDLTLTFGSSVQVPGEIAYLHPEHNFAVIRYDPAQLGKTQVESATLYRRELTPGEPVWVVGYSPAARLISRETRVGRLEPLALPMTRPPRFRDQNIELLELEDFPPTLGGVVADSQGRVLAIWASFYSAGGPTPEASFAGIPIDRVLPVVNALREGRPVDWRSLGVEFRPLNLADARHRGVSAAFAAQIEARDPQHPQVLSVLRIAAGTGAADRLREGDLVMEIDGAVVTRFDEVERASQAPAVSLRVLRDGEEIEVDVPTVRLPGTGTERAVLWAGALIQEPHWALPMQWGLGTQGVYVSRYWYGSPANRYGLRATRRILAVDGNPTPDLDRFLSAVADKPDRGPVRIKTVSLDGKVEVITLKLDLEYWPTSMLEQGGEGWQRQRVSSGLESPKGS